MDLLPKEHKQFQDEEYWNRFFADKKINQGFEWYATFEDLEQNLKVTLKDKEQRILVVGCGNSLLSEKMHLKMGLNKITSIDFEEAVIKKMIHREKPIDYQVMDMLNMTFENESYDYVIDKGTLDALCTDRSPETAAKVCKYLNEVVRVLNPKGGTFICVSLLQDFVLDALVSFFSNGLGNDHFDKQLVDFRIQRLDKRQKKGEDRETNNYLPFYITIKRTAINSEDAKMLELRDKLSKVISYAESIVSKAELTTSTSIQDKIKKEQINQMLVPQMKELNLGQRFELFCYDKSAKDQLSQVPRYTLTIVDSTDAKVLKKRTCAAFITPQGKERESLISTEVGKQNLSQQAGYSRLIIITLNHGHKFESIDTVKNELSPKVLELAPTHCANYKEIPFLTIGSDIGERGSVYTSQDGSIFVEDLKDEQHNIYRQVIFSSKPEQIQSEVLLVYRNPAKGGIPDHLKIQSTIAPKKKQRTIVLNHELLCSEYQYSMLSGFSLAPKLVEKDNIRILVLGTGAGLLPMFLKGQLGERLKELVTVDINEEIVKVAKEYFGFVTDDKLKSVIADAYEYVNNYNSAKFDVIIMDINYEESELNLSPPLKFMDAGFLRKLLDMTTNEGFVTFNLLCYDNETREKVFGMISETPKSWKYQIEGEEDVNRIIHLVKNQAPNEEQRHIQMDKVCKEWGLNKGLWLTEMRINQKIDKLLEISKK